MAVMVRDLPEDERPREKLIASGPGSLSNTELLAILLRTGTRHDSVLHVAEEVLSRYKDAGMSAMMHVSPQELATINGIGLAKAATVVAAIELGRRLAMKAAAKIETVSGPADAAGYAMPHFGRAAQENFAVMMLNMKNHILGMPIVSVGGLSGSVIKPREVFKAALQYGAASVILLHNHPSGDPSPSPEDIAVTKRMAEAGRIMGIPVLDHIVLGHGRFTSLKENGDL